MPHKRNLIRTRIVGAGAPPSLSERSDDDLPDPPEATEVAPDEGARHAVYFITDPNMRLLYVGTSTRIINRLRRHAIEKDWFTPDCRIFVEWFRDREDAYLRETNAIFHGHPEHNRMISKPSGPSPEPDIPLRPLTDLRRDVASVCSNCGMGRVRSLGLCGACYAYEHRHGAPRPSQLYAH